MTKRLFSVLTLVVILFAFVSCKSNNDSIADTEKEVTEYPKGSVEYELKEEFEKYTNPSDDLKEYAEISDMAALQAKFSEMRQIDILTITDEAVTLKISAPDLRPALLEYIDSNKEITDYGEELSVLDELMMKELSNSTTQYVESEVTVPYTIADDNSLQIEETEEFYDAIYGGLITFIKGYEGED